MVKLRLKRGGRKGVPFYTIVAIDSRRGRDSKYLEKIGYYDPLKPAGDPKRIHLDVSLYNKWIEMGAQPTDRVEFLFKKASENPQVAEKVVEKDTKEKNINASEAA